MRLKCLLLGIAMAAVAGAAAAADYVVVASTDPLVRRGQELAGGQRLALAPGKTVTVMHASGAVVVLRGTAAGVVLPGRPASTSADEERMAVLKLMVTAPPRDKFGRARSLCPPAATLTTLDGIVEAQKAGCADEATDALDAYVAKAAEPQG